MRIEIGPGVDPQPGYTHFVDARSDIAEKLNKIGKFYHLDFARDGLVPTFGKNVADRILAIHMLEHVGQDKQDFFFHQAKQVLKPGGVLEVHVPNFDAIVKLYQTWKDRKDLDKMMDHMQVILFGAGEGWHDKHRIAYNWQMLEHRFIRNGFNNVRNLTTTKEDRHTKGWRWAQKEAEKHLGACPPVSLIVEGQK